MTATTTTRAARNNNNNPRARAVIAALASAPAGYSVKWVKECSLHPGKFVIQMLDYNGKSVGHSCPRCEGEEMERFHENERARAWEGE